MPIKNLLKKIFHPDNLSGSKFYGVIPTDDWDSIFAMMITSTAYGQLILRDCMTEQKGVFVPFDIGTEIVGIYNKTRQPSRP